MIRQDEYSALLREGQTYVSCVFQLQSPQRFLRVAPPLVPDAVLFDCHEEKKFISQFYYQQVNDRLIFACTAYLYPGKRDRIIISFTRDICTMPADFMTLPPEQFDQLLACQHDWQQRLSLLAAQL